MRSEKLTFELCNKEVIGDKLHLSWKEWLRKKQELSSVIFF